MASDPTADMLNMSGLGGIYGANPYLEFTGQIPMAGYSGWPTDSQGRPIQQPPGMTLNQTQAAPAQQPTVAQSALSALGMGQLQQQRPGTANYLLIQPLGGQQQAAPQQPASPSNSSGLTRQQYLQLLANPGNPAMPGAQQYPGAQQTGAPAPSVLSQFLSAHQGGGSTGAGGYTNAPFFSTLSKLQNAGS